MTKKQIKNLTIEEVEKICDKQPVCNNCPLEITSEHYCVKNLIMYYKEFLEKEIEVEDDAI